ncbi:MAG: hypothetical protein WC289_04970 [Patescibacteria group bacterium]|jgi:hypothetical protein
MPDYINEHGCIYCGESSGHLATCPRVLTNEYKGEGKADIRKSSTEVDWRMAEKREDTEAETAYYQSLIAAHETVDPFPTSTSHTNEDANTNNDIAQQRYTEYMPPYKQNIHDTEKNYWNGDVNIGHKLHLNVPVTSIHDVAEYLKRLNIEHKYLSGGDVTDGKVFTIYCGSKDRADAVATQISADLHPHLRRPANTSEVEYAPNVSGRFMGSQKEWGQYPVGKMRGIAALTEDRQLLFGYKVLSEQDKQRKSKEAFKRSFDRAAEIYGTYFYGSTKAENIDQ